MRWQLRNRQLLSIGMPLLVVAVLFYFAGVYESNGTASSFLINLSATAIGSLATVFFIDIVRRVEEERQWNVLDKGISQEIVTAAAGAMTQIEALYRRQQGLPPSSSITAIDAEAIRFTQETVIPGLESMLAGFNRADGVSFVGDGWQALTHALERIAKDFESLHLLYYPRLRPEDLSQIQRSRVSATQARSLVSAAPSLGIGPDVVTGMVAASLASILRASIGLVSRHGKKSGFDAIEASAER